MFAEWFFEVNSLVDGTPKIEHLRQVERQTGRTPRGLQGPPFPDLLRPVWSAFVVLSNSRSYSQGRPNPITYDQILAWTKLTESVLSARDVEAVKRLDNVYLRNLI